MRPHNNVLGDGVIRFLPFGPLKVVLLWIFSGSYGSGLLLLFALQIGFQTQDTGSEENDPSQENEN
jgi:hypothetical protein